MKILLYKNKNRAEAAGLADRKQVGDRFGGSAKALVALPAYDFIPIIVLFRFRLLNKYTSTFFEIPCV